MRRIIIIAILLLPAIAHAGRFYLNPEILTQVRKDSLNTRQVPFDFYLNTGVYDLPEEGTFDVSLRNDHIFNIGENQFDLYQAVFRMKDIGDAVDISAGRQFLSPGYHAYLIDGLTTDIGKDDWPVHVGFVAGVPRYLEISDFHGNVGLLAGTTLQLNGFDNTSAKLSAMYNSIKATEGDWKKNQTVLVGLGLYHKFSAKVLPELYGDFEYDTAGKVINTGIAGFGFRPHWRVYLNVEGGVYNVDREWRMPSILGLYSLGPMYQGDTGLNILLYEGNDVFEGVSLDASYSFQRFEAASKKADYGNLAMGGLNFTILPAKLDTSIAYRFYDSFGGRANDVQLSLHEEPAKKVYIDFTANYTKYVKITNDNDDAIGLFLMTGVEVLKNLVLSAGGEYLRNNTFRNELRATAQLSYNLDGKL